MLDDLEEEAFPGYDEDIRMEEYREIRKIINKKYNSTLSESQVRLEFERAYNKLFDSMMESYSHRVFHIIYVMMDCFNIDEIKAFRYLNVQNKEKVRNFALNKDKSWYWQKKEKEKIKNKMNKKGKSLLEAQDIKNLFK